MTRAAPWLAFLVLLLAGWRVWPARLAGALPAYGDVLEVVWSVSWYAGALRGEHGFWVYPSVFYPVGWHVATFASGPAMFLLLLPLNWLGGPAFAYNVTTLLAFVLAFAGALRLARRYLDPLPAAVAALLFTFWGFRWSRIDGHLNILLASALLPWLAWSVEQALAASRRGLRWWLLAGGIWAFMIACSWYFVWMGGILLAAWLLGHWLARRAAGRRVLAGLFVSAAVALVLTVPLLVWFLQGSAAAGASFYEIEEVARWDASLNSLPLPSIRHPWLGALARSLYRGPVNEPGQANLGLAACLLALAGLASAWRNRRWRPVVVLAAVALILTLGLALKWNGRPLQAGWLRPLDNLIWAVGHALKPDVFVSARPPAPFDAAVPLPGLLLSAVVPFWERARVFARYGLLLGMGVFMLAGLGLSRLRLPWLRLLAAGVLLFEVVPPPSQAVPFPPPSHPAFEWLKQQDLAGGAILDLGSWQRTLAYMPIGGDTLWATTYHGRPTVAGASSLWPAHVAYLDRWLAAHPHPFAGPDLIPLLRQYRVRLLVLHVTGGEAQEMLAEARGNPELEDLRCFAPLDQPGPWRYPICVARVPAPRQPQLNVMFEEGWSDEESWGRWSDSTLARAGWIALEEGAQHLTLEAFPVCVPGRPQHLAVEINGRVLAEHRWQDCEPWTARVTIPADLVRIGANTLQLRSAFTAQPAGDPRTLSVGVTRLLVADPALPG